MNTVLVVTYLFPPFSSGGVVRIHNFVKYMPQFGVRPIVLSIDEQYYPSTYRNESLLDEYDDSVEIVRTKSAEPVAGNFRDKIYGVQKRTSVDKLIMSLIKKTVDPLLVPDRNVMWMPYAVRAGRRLVRGRHIDAVLSTGPPFTTHLVAYHIAKKAGIPLILDFRDDWIGNIYYDWGNPIRKWIQRNLERRAVNRADRVISASSESVELFRSKYPRMNPGKFIHISNGFDPELFGDVTPRPMSDGKISFVYTGSLTPDRTPKYFLLAVKELISDQPELADVIRIRFVGYAPIQHEELVDSLGMSDLVEFVHSVPQREVARILTEQTGVTLIFQRESEGGDTAIPGKLYEYIAARRPILCMADGGATVNLLDRLGSSLITRYDDVGAIKNKLREIVTGYERVSAAFDWPEDVMNKFSRREQAKDLVSTITEVVDARDTFGDKHTEG